MGALVAFSGVLGFFLPAVNRWEKEREARRGRKIAQLFDSAGCPNNSGGKVPQIVEPNLVAAVAPPDSPTREEDEENLPGSQHNTIHARL